MWQNSCAVLHDDGDKAGWGVLCQVSGCAGNRRQIGRKNLSAQALGTGCLVQAAAVLALKIPGVSQNSSVKWGEFLVAALCEGV